VLAIVSLIFMFTPSGYANKLKKYDPSLDDVELAHSLNNIQEG